MFLTQLHLKNFRCFSDATFHFEGPLILIEGLNGSGKTSLLEALHYLCYMRSFRTHTPRELLASGHEAFFIRALFSNTPTNEQNNELQVGFSGKKRLVKINHKTISSYKELMDFYRIVTVTEDDVSLIHGNPEVRRSFIDHALVLYNPDYATIIRKMHQIIEQRNSMLKRPYDAESYRLWTQQLWDTSREIRDLRIEALEALEQETNILLARYFGENLWVSFVYKARRIEHDTTLENFMARVNLIQEEMRYGHSCFGAHLDDFIINFQDKKSKNYSSRGQQKLVVLLIKIAQIKKLLAHKGPAILLLDDFMTDFDGDRINKLLDLLFDLKIQLIFTSPAVTHFLSERLTNQGAYRLKLSY